MRMAVLHTPLDAPILVMLLMLPISLWVSADLPQSIAKAVGLLIGVAIFYATVATQRVLRRPGYVLAVYLVVGSAIALAGLLGTNWLPKYTPISWLQQWLPPWIRGLPGATSGFHPNEVAGVLLWFVPLQLALLVRRDARGMGWQRVLLSCVAVLTAAVLLLTQSRGAWMGLLLGLVEMCAYGRPGTRALFLAGSALGLVAALLLASSLLLGSSPPQLPGLQPSSWTFRALVWRAALNGLSEFPFTGIGLGAFRSSARYLYLLPLIPADYNFGHAHNGFLQAGLDLGLPGLLAYAAIWCQLVRLLLAVPSKRSDTTCCFERQSSFLVACGLWGCLVSSFAFNLTDTVALGARGGLPWWMMLGLIVGVDHEPSSDGSHQHSLLPKQDLSQ